MTPTLGQERGSSTRSYVHAEAGGAVQDVFGEELWQHQGHGADRALRPRGKNSTAVSA